MSFNQTLGPNLPEENTTIIANATMIKERVLVPRQRIVWWLYGWSQGPVLIADRESVLIFDIEKRELHTISTKVPAHPTYVMHKIFKLFTEHGKVGADIHFSPHQTIQPVSAVEGQRWISVLLLSRVHQLTYQRLLAMRD